MGSQNAEQTNKGEVRNGFSLVEILLVVAILGILATTAIPLFQPNLTEELENAARIVAADAERARQLAVVNNSKYKLVSKTDNTGYYLQHSGANTSLNALPAFAYKQKTDPADRQTTLFATLPGLSAIQLFAVVQVLTASRQSVSDLEFGPLGNTTRTSPTEIWLVAGTGTAQRYIPITINPVTGLATVGDIAGAPPTLTAASSGS